MDTPNSPETASMLAKARPLSTPRMVLICLALLLEGMSSSSINVQVAAIRSDLDLDGVALQLVAGAFLVAYAGLLPAAGRLADSANTRTAFLLGVSAFGIGCVICAAAPEGWFVVAGRVVQGVGAALSAPAALALTTTGLPAGPRRNRAVALYGAMGALGFSLGLVVPSVVVSFFGWRASFLISVPVVVIVLAATWPVRTSGPRSSERADVPGAVMLAGALMVAMHLLGAVTTASGWMLAIELGVVLVAVAVLARRGGVAGFPRDVVRCPAVVACCLALAAVFAGVVSSMYVLSLGLQVLDGTPAYAVGLLILPQPVMFSALSGLGARIVSRVGVAPTLAAGMAVIIISLLYVGLAHSGVPLVAAVLPAMAGVGAGLALCFPAASIGAIDAVGAEFRGTAAGLLTASQNVGGALGLAVVTALALIPETGVPGTGDSAGLEGGMYAAAVAIVIGGTLAGLVARSSSADLSKEGRGDDSEWDARSSPGL